MIYTTLNKIKAHCPCQGGWEKLLSSLGKTEPDDEELSFKTILGSNGVADAIWALRTIEGHDKEIRLFAVSCARRVRYLMTDKRSLDVLDVAEKYAHGEVSGEELDAARDAAWHAASAAWHAASAASAASAERAARAAIAAADAAELSAAYAAAYAAAAATDSTESIVLDVEVEWQTLEFLRVFCSE